ncbi:Ribokinase [Micractinium conductrix]|uniref:Ribokinase n=1 Tax=Micractinium conductrix TaxID=554055 RepID=A0A2P6VG99_9CHLO|nr:Ribokinase [Micractinium conductrix]|eukprot:PSC73119.1 Ribokinase [Micractinium conductrix]
MTQWVRRKQYDVVSLSNLCVDIVVEVEQLPPADADSRRALLQQLTAQPPPMEQWSVGGNTNFLIAAARMGLRTASVGHLGQDVYGIYMRDVLQAEGVRSVEPLASDTLTPEQDQTLLCFVLVAPDGKHAFCSRYDFGPHPLLPFARSLPPRVTQLLENTEALFINGFVFDELPAEAVLGAARAAATAGAAVFFDPGPRSWTFAEGERNAALAAMLDAADVVLMTDDEAEAVTGLKGADAQARHILGRPGARTEWCVVKRGADGAILASRSEAGRLYTQQALRVDVRDTVGCGDSFAAAVVLGFSRGHTIPAVMALANAVGAATAMGQGAGRNVARADTVLRLLQEAVPGCADGRHADAVGVLTSSLTSGDWE